MTMLVHRSVDRLMTRVVNPVVRRLLASPAHDLLGPRVAVVGVTGRRTGRTFHVPVNAMADDGGLVVLSRRDRRWWRNLRGGAAVSVLRDGRTFAGRATVDRLLSAEATAQLVERASAEAGHPIAVDRARAMARDRVVVRIALEPSGASSVPATPAAPLDGRALWRRWTVTVTAGETLAFVTPAAAGALLVAADASWALVVPVTLLAGAAEGATLGFAQALVVRRVLPGVGTRAWIGATAAGAVAAWAIGLVPFLAGDALGALPVAAQVVLVVVLGAALVSSIGLLQWRVLRLQVPRAGRWIPATALAWLLGLTAFMVVATPLWHEGQAPIAVVAIGVGAAAAMAVTVAAVSGAALVALTQRRDRGRADARRARRRTPGRTATRAGRPSARDSARAPEPRAPR